MPESDDEGNFHTLEEIRAHYAIEFKRETQSLENVMQSMLQLIRDCISAINRYENP